MSLRWKLSSRAHYDLSLLILGMTLGKLDSCFSRLLVSSTSHADVHIRDFNGLAPTHFLGELTKTPDGCRYLRDKGLVSDFAEIVRLHGMEASDQGVMTNVKSILWALVRAISHSLNV